MDAIFGVLAILLFLFSFINKKYVAFILVIICIVLLFIVQYNNHIYLQLFRGNYWIIIIPIFSLSIYVLYLKTFQKIKHLKFIFNKPYENFIGPVIEEMFFSFALILFISDANNVESFIAIFLTTTIFVNFHILFNSYKYNCENLFFLSLLSFATKITAIYSNIFYSIIIHVLFNIIVSIFKLPKPLKYFRLLNNNKIKNTIIFSEGENYIIKGKNGIGKTTFVKIQAKLLNAKNTTNNNFKEYSLLLQEAEYNFDLKWLDECFDFGERYHFWVNKMHFNELTKTKYTLLSSGEKQKFKIIITMISNPKKVFFDELENSLDLKTLDFILNILKEYQKTHDVSYIFITHKDGDKFNMFNPRKIIFLKDRVEYE